MSSTTDSSTIWTTLPATQQPNDKDATTVDLTAISEAYGSSSSTTSITSSVTSQYQYNSYPTTAQYAMYTSTTPANYYQQMTANLRAGTTAFPYSLTTPSYYAAGSYPVDYTSAAAAYQSPYYSSLRGGSTTPYYNPLNTAAAAYASVASSVLTSDAVNLGTSSDSSSTGVPSSAGSSCSPGDETYARVFVWDLEDIAVVSRPLLESTGHTFYATAAAGMFDLIDGIVKTSFSDIHEALEGDVTNIEDAVVEDPIMDQGPMDNLRGLDVMRRVAPKYAAFRQFYTDISAKFKQEPDFEPKLNAVLNYELLERVGLASRESELTQYALQLLAYNNCSQRWSAAQKCMDLVVERSRVSAEKYANVVLTHDGVIQGAAELLIAGLNSAVPMENIYSTMKQGKETIFEKIQTRYGKKCSLVYVSSRDTSKDTAKRLSLPFWPLQSNNDLTKLYHVEEMYLLGTP
uniref:Eyes absent homolog n=2 Tax=Caenorhabditis tropicalis TaxID=1561998 RepID=A0A1I7T705_9PELO